MIKMKEVRACNVCELDDGEVSIHWTDGKVHLCKKCIIRVVGHIDHYGKEVLHEAISNCNRAVKRFID